MSRCDAFREALLQAELDALSGGDPALAAHLEECPACAALARVVVERTGALGRRLTPPPPKPERMAALLREAGVGPKPAATPWARWLPLAAAAAVAGLLLARSGPAPHTPPPPRPDPSLPVVEAAPGHDVAVLATTNPDITVLWFFDAGAHP